MWPARKEQKCYSKKSFEISSKGTVRNKKECQAKVRFWQFILRVDKKHTEDEFEAWHYNAIHKHHIIGKVLSV